MDEKIGDLFWWSIRTKFDKIGTHKEPSIMEWWKIDI
jgi:hypothetical protein